MSRSRPEKANGPGEHDPDRPYNLSPGGRRHSGRYRTYRRYSSGSGVLNDTHVGPRVTARHSNPVSQAGFTMIPNAIMLRVDLSCGAKIVYGYLKHLAWRDASEEVATTREVIQRDLGIGKNQVTAYIQELTQEPILEGDLQESSPKLVETYRQGRGLPNIYVIHDPVIAPKVIPPIRVTPEKAHQIVNDAVRRGSLVRQPCEVCGTTGKGASGRSLVHAHHDDYTKPLDVRWLCQRHHSEYHQCLRSAGRVAVR